VCDCDEEGRSTNRSLCTFLVAFGRVTDIPSKSLHMITWQPRRLVSVKPGAKSSMSFSSSLGSSILS
jgi:hypothetical protein